MGWNFWVTAVGAFAFGIASATAQEAKQFAGITAYYSPDHEGRTASGERYDPKKFTAAHRTLPFGTRLRVTARDNNRSVVVVVNDRGPFTDGRVLDLSFAAAEALHMVDRGITKIVAVVQPNPQRLDVDR